MAGTLIQQLIDAFKVPAEGQVFISIKLKQDRGSARPRFNTRSNSSANTSQATPLRSMKHRSRRTTNRFEQNGSIR
jgi:hypothetical protein